MYSSRPSQQFSAILVIGIVVVFTSQIPNVDAYYCDDNLCSAEQVNRNIGISVDCRLYE